MRLPAGSMGFFRKLGVEKLFRTAQRSTQRARVAIRGPASPDNFMRTPANFVSYRTSPETFLKRIGGVPDRWAQSGLGQGSHAGQGFKLAERNAAGALTGRQLRLHPGGGRHGPDPYWVFTSPTHGKIRIVGPNFRS